MKKNHKKKSRGAEVDSVFSDLEGSYYSPIKMNPFAFNKYLY